MPVASDYPPYVNGYGESLSFSLKLKKPLSRQSLLGFVNTALGLKSSSYRAMIPLLKKLGFIDSNNIPTQAYKDFRENSISGAVMADRLRIAYHALYRERIRIQARKEGSPVETQELARGSGRLLKYCLCGEYVSGAVKIGGLGRSRATTQGRRPRPPSDAESNGRGEKTGGKGLLQPGPLVYDQSDSPATTEIEVFNAIFKSLRENLLG